jgi:hypothetical protein
MNYTSTPSRRLHIHTRRVAIALFLIAGKALCPEHAGIDERPKIMVRLVRSIARHENCAAWRNPGCLAFADQPGATRLPNGYAQFRTREDGRVALERDLRAKLGRGLTVAQISIAWNGGLYLDALLKESGLQREARWR